MFTNLLLAALITGVADGLFVHHSLPDTPRPVRMVKQPSVGDIKFVGFEFQEPTLYELSVHYGPIKGQPRRGEEYGVRASIGGEEAIASMTFDAIDETGQKIQRVPIVFTREYHYPEFIGLMKVPSRPFRIVMSGESVDGQSFTRVYPRLFNPINTTKPTAPFLEVMSQEDAAVFQQMFDALAPETVAKRQALVAANPSGQIVMPRTRVSSVAYAPLVSPAGRPLGVKVTYDVTFSERGEYDPQVDLYALYFADNSDYLIGINQLRVIYSEITPSPHDLPGYEEAYKTARTGDWYRLRNYLYEADTVYRFTVHAVPDFIVFDKDADVVPCFAAKDVQQQSKGQDRLTRRLTTDGPAKYQLRIRAAGLEGILENFYSEKSFYEAFSAEGMRNCAQRQP